MNLAIKMNLDNDAFTDDAFTEVLCCVCAALRRLKRNSDNLTSPYECHVMDVNGNSVGTAKVTA